MQDAQKKYTIFIVHFYNHSILRFNHGILPKNIGRTLSDPAVPGAETEGFEPSCRLPGKLISSQPRYDHFDTSPCVRRFSPDDAIVYQIFPDSSSPYSYALLSSDVRLLLSLICAILPRSFENVKASLYFIKKALMERDFSSSGRKK